MGIDIKIKIDLTPTQKRIMRGAVVGGVVIGALGLGLAVATPKQWKMNDPLAAADINSLGIVVKNGHPYSLRATYCGKTASTTGQVTVTNGYAGAKSQCEGVTTCGGGVGSPSAHMCTGDEILRSVQVGLTVDDGWYAAGNYANNGGNSIYDCKGWTSNSLSDDGSFWNSSQNRPAYDHCSSSDQILCCD